METKTFFKIVAFIFLNVLFLCASSLKAQVNSNEDKTLSPYFVVICKDSKTDNLPLKETSVKADIVGMIADVTVRQVYVNAGKNPLEAVYTFPLSTKAAVYGMEMKIGKRIVTAKIEEKEKARNAYEKAKSQGKRASLLEQNRPNVFTMNVSNIMVNDTIVVELKYTELLVPEKGQYSFVYPTVVGPRYTGNNSSEGDDTYTNTPYTKSGEMPKYIFDFEATINAGIPIQSIDCKTHKMNLAHPSFTKSTMRLDKSESAGGNRDVVINYSLRGYDIMSGVMLYEGEDENFFLMVVQPPKQVLKENIPPREFIFIVDVSGSMNGFPLDVSKKLMRNLIINLKPDDKFNVILFSGSTGILSNTGSINATEENIGRAINYINKERGGGGTELLQALEAAYRIPLPDEDISRTFVAITDGYVSVEREAFDLIRKNSSHTNFFSFGIGSSVNRYLIEGMAFMGNGEAMIVLNESEAESKAEQFRNYINTPVLTRIKTDFGPFTVYDVEPISVPDMLAERPIVIYGKYRGKPSGTILLSGKTGRKSYKKTIDLSNINPEKSNSAIRYLWARERIKYLDYMSSSKFYRRYNGDETDYAKRITELGLKYNLMTNYTSFIAIDEVIVNENGTLTKVKQPVPLPEGVSDYAIEASEDMMKSSIAAPSILHIVQEEESEASENYVFNTVETMPDFPGGQAGVLKYISENMVYPKEAAENGISGRVMISFYVEVDGSVSEVTVIRGIDPLLDKEAIRLIKSMPKWTPAKQNGKPVRVKYTVPVIFRLQNIK